MAEKKAMSADEAKAADEKAKEAADAKAAAAVGDYPGAPKGIAPDDEGGTDVEDIPEPGPTIDEIAAEQEDAKTDEPPPIGTPLAQPTPIVGSPTVPPQDVKEIVETAAEDKPVAAGQVEQARIARIRGGQLDGAGGAVVLGVQGTQKETEAGQALAEASREVSENVAAAEGGDK